MTPEQMDELNCWINLNIFDKQPAYSIMKRGVYYRPESQGYTNDINEAWHCTKQVAEYELIDGEDMKAVPVPTRKYTTDPAAAMEVLKVCSKKYAVIIRDNDKGFSVLISLDPKNPLNVFQAETIELAICLFAKKLFTK